MLKGGKWTLLGTLSGDTEDTKKTPGQTKVTSITSDAATRPDKHRALPEPEGELRTVWNAWWKKWVLGIGVAVRPTAAIRGPSVFIPLSIVWKFAQMRGPVKALKESMSRWTELNVRNIKWI